MSVSAELHAYEPRPTYLQSDRHQRQRSANRQAAELQLEDPRLIRAFALSCLGLLLLAASAAAEPALPEGFQDSVAISNLEQPTNFRFAPDGRVFVAEKPGKILVFENIEDTTPEVFADL